MSPAPQPAQAPRDAGNKADGEKEALLLEPGKAIKRILAGADSHTYQIRLSAGQFVKVIVDQQGIDVVAQLSGPSGEQIIRFDGEVSSRGQELAPFVAEAAGVYRLTVRPKRKNAPTAGYEIRIEELRDATGDDYALHATRKMLQEWLILLDEGKYEEALSLVERSREIRERVLGPEHRDVADALNELGRLYFYNGDYAKAESLYQRALAIRERVLGPEHLDAAGSLHNLALLYETRSDHAKAELLYHRALAIMEQALGQEHPLVGDSLDALALLYSEKGDYAKAEQMHRRALSIRENALGHEDLDVARSLNNLAIICRKKGDYAKAEQNYRSALNIMEKLLGSEHPNVARSLDGLAILYFDKGD
jgi:Tfp pilus assembly protein PilF